MNFKTNNAYLECLDVNYDNTYLNRYIDSINVLNYIDTENDSNSTKLYFNYIDVFNRDLTDSTITKINESIKLSDLKLSELMDSINIKIPDTLFNNKILFFRNANDFISKTSNLFKLEEYIESTFPHSFLALRSEIDLCVLGYTELYKNHYIKKLY